MRKITVFVLSFLLIGTAVSKAWATENLDTGTPNPPASLTPKALNNGGSYFNFLAGRFEIEEAVDVNSLEGYLRGNAYGTLTGTLDAVIYGDVSGMLDPATEIFRGSFVIPDSDLYEWRGIYGLSKSLSADAYWLAFEADSGEAYSAMLRGAPNPWDQYAFSNELTGVWVNDPNLNLGMRVGASVAPEPVSTVLFLAGGAVLGSALKRKKWSAGPVSSSWKD